MPRSETWWWAQVMEIRALVDRKVQKDVDRLKAERDAALGVSSTSYRDALTEQVMENGHPIGSLAELAHVTVTDETRNFQIQADIADELRRWTVPPWARPHCSLDPVKMCTSWTCLVDRCARADEGTRDEGTGGATNESERDG